METAGIGTENQTEDSIRSTRRSKNSKNINRSVLGKLKKVKSQENINTSGEEVYVSVSVNEEVTKNISTIVKPGTSATINPSTSRKKKDPLANLHSNLSPKYIGFRTPPDKLDSSSVERTRSLRRRHNNSNADTSLERDSSLDSSFTPNNIPTVDYVRRKVTNKELQTTPDRSTKRKKFVSPIDKLLIENRAVMEDDNSLLLEDNVEIIRKSLIYPEDDNNSSSMVKEDEKETGTEASVTEIENEIGDENLTNRENDSINIINAYEKNDENNKTNVEKNVSIYQNENESDMQYKENEKDTLAVEEIEGQTDEKNNYERKSMVENSDVTLGMGEENKKTNISIMESIDNEQNGNILVKVETESIGTKSNIEFLVDAVTTINSPSAVSMDSAKGSSIINEVSWMSFSTGDLYWGQIYNYCFWPCIVCPDPNGKTISTEEVNRNGFQNVLVHVRFFADNGRRNWVKRENLLPYNGVDNYQDRIDEVRQKYGAKSNKYKLHVPSKRKQSVWLEAINEANMVAGIAHPKRLEKFYEIFEKSKAFHKLEKQRRKSMYISVNYEAPSNVESSSVSNTANNLGLQKLKRARSISPYSPVYSPIKSITAKRRKLNDDEQETATTSCNNVVSSNTSVGHRGNKNADINLSPTNSVASSTISNSLNDLEIFNGPEFKKFSAVMKDFVMEQNHNEKLEKSLVVAVRNIWALKQLSRRQMERKLRESLNISDINSSVDTVNVRRSGESSVKRLSTRLKTLIKQQTPESTPERSFTQKTSKETANIEKVKKPINRPILEVIDDIFDLDRKYLFKGMSRDPVCKYCFKPGDNLKRCAKNCSYWLHQDCLYKDFTQSGKARRSIKHHSSTKISNLSEIGDSAHVTGDDIVVTEVICKECANNEPTKCMVCNCTESKIEDDPLVKCFMTQCERAFHPECCKYWPQAKITISKKNIESFRCPSHVCHTCVSDDPKGKFQHISNSKLTKCVKCPATYHTDSTCIPAGSEILTAAHIICPRHTSIKHDMTVNVNWCFICVGGGQVICCETCPTAVHAHCLKIPVAANEGYICEECESGRMPLYGEIVWAKFNNFRWWPAIILPPTEIPKNIARKAHNPSDFVVRFFGTHDHGWISRRRVYLYLEGDSSEPPRTKSTLDLNYNRGVEEAKEVYEIIKSKKIQQSNSNESKEKLHPQPYVRIKANRAVLPVRLHVDIESVSKCECDPNDENPCGPDTNCLNRVLYHECNPKICPAGERCQNQMFESRKSPRLDVVYMKERGFGLVCREPIKAGSFVIEYVGEIINDDEFKARMQQKSRDRDENFYFLSVEKDYIIDAGPKGNLARFMNHSCDPNCETQKWLVNSLNRVGLFAIKDIPENTELTFNYHWDDLLGNEKKTCYCGAKKCAGQIGGKLKDMDSTKEPPANATSKNKTKAKTKLIKRPLDGAHKGKMENKPKLVIKSRGKRATEAANATVLLKANDEPTTTPTNDEEEDIEDNKDTSNGEGVKSPDFFC